MRPQSEPALATAPPEGAQVIRLPGAFGVHAARSLSRRVRRDLGRGTRRFVVDLTEAPAVAEGPLVLALLSLRSALERAEARLVVAGPEALASRLAASLRLDGALDAAPSLAEALETAAGRKAAA